ncbi:acylneuraminate cytidylyltransferase family protein [Planktomarina sp.]|nr:acylneuraminate cytidylyltransferase family protein [Planktomarina sp.]
MDVLAIIPARAGSKRLPDKNILRLGGKPLLTWTIEAALQSNFFLHTIVSTNSAEIKSAAIAAGADVPFIRPDVLSGDESSSSDVVMHALDFFKKMHSVSFDYVALLQPTSPLRTGKHIIEAFDIMLRCDAGSCVSVVESNCNPNWLFWHDKKTNFMRPVLEEPSLAQGHKNGPTYVLNGAIYICRVSDFLKYQKFVFFNTVPYVMNPTASIDIDTKDDFDRANEAIKGNYAQTNQV